MDLKDVRIIVQDVRIGPVAVCSCVEVMVASQISWCWTLPDICLVPFTKNVLLMTKDWTGASWCFEVKTPSVAQRFADNSSPSTVIVPVIKL